MAEIVYALCAVMSTIVAGLLWRGFRRTGARLLLWSALCFGVYAASCIYLFVDMGMYPDFDSNGPLWRNLLGATSGSLLLFGLIWEIA